VVIVAGTAIAANTVIPAGLAILAGAKETGSTTAASAASRRGNAAGNGERSLEEGLGVSPSLDAVAGHEGFAGDTAKAYFTWITDKSFAGDAAYAGVGHGLAVDF
jgi:hypothetical protein